MAQHCFEGHLRSVLSIHDASQRAEALRNLAEILLVVLQDRQHTIEMLREKDRVLELVLADSTATKGLFMSALEASRATDFSRATTVEQV